MFREWRASGADSHTISNAGLHAKYAVLMCARAPGETVEIAQSLDSSSSRRVIATRRLREGCLAMRLTGMRRHDAGTRTRLLFRAGPIRRPRIRRPPRAGRVRPGASDPARSTPGQGFPGPLRGPDPAHAAPEVGVRDRGPREGAGFVELDRLPEASGAGFREGHLLRDEVDEARYALARRERRRPARAGRARPARRVRDGVLRRGIHDQRAASGAHQRTVVRRVRVRRQATRTRAWRTGAARRTASLLLEER